MRLDQDRYHLVAAKDARAARIKFLKENPIFPSRGSVVGRVAMQRRTVQIMDALADPEYTLSMSDDSGYGTMLGVPLLRDDVVIGVVVLTRGVVQPFEAQQIELVTTFADQAIIAIENARLFEELQTRTRELCESLEQQTATSEVLGVISSSPGELQPVFDAMLERATRICEAQFGNLFLRDGDEFRGNAIIGEADYVALWRRNPVINLAKNPGIPIDRIVWTKQVLHIADMRTDPSYLAGNPRIRALVDTAGARTFTCVPMLKDGEVIGAIAMYRQEARSFTDQQIELVTNFAAQAVIAIENTRLLNELRESLRQQTATADVLKVISRSTFDLNAVLQTLVESAARLCDADKGTITRQKDGVFFRAEAFGFSSEFMEYVRDIPVEPERRTATGRAPLEGQIVHIPDVLADSDYAFGEAQKLGDFRTILGVPMLREGITIGVLTLTRSEVRPFSDKQIELVSTFADQAAIAIENARLLDELRQRTGELTESLQQQTATAEVLEVISRSAFDLNAVFETVAEHSVKLCEADRAFIFRFDGELLRMAVAFNASQDFKEWVERNPIRPGRQSGSARAALERRTIHIPDVLADPAYSYWVKNVEAIRTVLGVPILKGDDLLGVMMIYRLEVRPFTDKQITLVETFADQAAIAIENVRLFERVETRTRELAKSLEELRTAQDRLVQTQKLASLGQLTAGIAHEIKNPLNFVNNFSAVSVELIDELRELLANLRLEGDKSAEITELADTLQGNLDKIAQHGKRADSIVKNMLLHSREGSGEQRPVDINAIVEESLNLAYHGARAEKQGFNITLERSFDPNAGQVDLYPQEITRVFLNLISNGFYAATKRKPLAGGVTREPTLTATTKDLGDKVEIRIRDNGDRGGRCCRVQPSYGGGRRRHAFSA
jgi:two-component system, NtrC family, sensor kinase